MKRREARKEKFARAMGLAHLDRFLTSMQLRDLESKRGMQHHRAPAAYPMPGQAIGGPPRGAAIQPVQAYPSLPPHMRPGQGPKEGQR